MSIYTYMSFIEFMKEQGLEEAIENMPLIQLKKYLDNWKLVYDNR